MKTSRKYKAAEIEFAFIDLQDAFCHFGLHPDELKRAVSPGLDSGTGGTGIVWRAMLFGLKGAPLVMGRLECSHWTTHTSIDDVLLALRG